MIDEVRKSELEVIATQGNYHLARYEGKLGLWTSYTKTEDWNGEDFVPLASPVEVAYQWDDDVNEEFAENGLFEHRIVKHEEELRYLAKFD